MALSYHIDPEAGLITVQGEGEISLSDLLHTGHSLLLDVDFDPELPQLLDFRGLRPIMDGDPEELREFVQGPFRDVVMGNVAVVIDEHLEDEHCADIFLLTCAVHDAELFSDYDQALRWIVRQAFMRQPMALAHQQYAAGNHAYGAPE